MAREKELPPEVAEEAPPKPKGKLKKIIILVVLLFVLLGGGAFAYLLLVDEPTTDKTKHVEKAMMPLEPFLVNLADKDSRRYLKVKIDLEVDTEKTAKELEKAMPRIRDQLIFLLSSKSYQDISTPEGKLQLKKEILARLTALPTGKKISGAYFTEFVAQ
ncbi:MAG: flagellar basal body-associated FliL family protein [Deltaproteobacteria bacterium]|nr:flagellar basal body-associated FliL family protein [Deltaproteobacteria bacterium]MBI4795657.1 flagellar basal body-associated FliL family protein [Deltaproteobacteria bacterium]